MKQFKQFLLVIAFGAALPVVFPAINIAKMDQGAIIEQPEAQGEPDVQKEPEVEEKKVVTITMHSNRYCPPCRAFVSECKEDLEEAGWKVVVLYKHDSATTPTFVVSLLDGSTHKKVGYKGRNDMMRWLKSLLPPKTSNRRGK